MNMTPQTAFRALWGTITDPANAARHVLQWPISLLNLWSVLVLVAVLNVLMLALLQAVSPVPVVLQDQGLVLTPFSYAAIILVFLFLLVYTIYQIGRMMGGQGSVEDCLKAIILFQTVSVSLEAVQVLLVIISPMIAGYFGIISLVILIRCILNFVNVMHRFESIGKTILTLLFALIATALIAGIVLSVLGVAPTGMQA
ncbi:MULTISPECIES: YIP1 family protein [unclassified Yoonia]|uniref:YIP1 family protein n=1 Tax=unclassified Yoonia TaxID=2629118 RepID=UPI002AFE6096|nr:MULTISPECIES: YIP1 family protein [unclassified Yoonia]